MSIEAQEPSIESTNLVDAAGINLAAVSATGAVKVDGSAVTQPVSGTVTVGNATLAVTESGIWNITNISGTISLPTGAATAANQATEIASLASIDAGIPVALGQTTMAASMPVVIASNQSAIPVSGTFFQATQPISGTVTALQGTSPWVTSLASTTITGTVAVTQSTSPWVVSLTSTTITGTVTVAGAKTNNNAAPGATNVGVLPALANAANPAWTEGDQVLLSENLSGQLRTTGGGVAQASTTLGQLGQLAQGAVTTANPTYTTGQTDPLSLTTAGALRTDNTSWLGSTAPTVGQKTMANSVPVVIASDQTDLATSLNALVTAKTVVMNTGTLITTATTSDQVILTYTVTAAHTFYLEYCTMLAYLTSLPGNANPVFLGKMSLESPAGTKEVTDAQFHANYNADNFTYSDPLPIAAGTVIRVVCTPNAATSTTWIANFGGYEA